MKSFCCGGLRVQAQVQGRLFVSEPLIVVVIRLASNNKEILVERKNPTSNSDAIRTACGRVESEESGIMRKPTFGHDSLTVTVRVPISITKRGGRINIQCCNRDLWVTF